MWFLKKSMDGMNEYEKEREEGSMRHENVYMHVR